MLSSAQLKEAFDGFDKDKSGSLELDEIVGLAMALGIKAKRSKLEALFSAIDANNDGQVNFEEFITWYRIGRHTQLTSLAKFYIVSNQEFREFQESKTALRLLSEVKSAEEPDQAVSIELLDGDSLRKSQVKLRLETGDRNTRFPALMKETGFAPAKSAPLIILAVKSRKPDKLKSTLDNTFFYICELLKQKAVLDLEADSRQVFPLIATKESKKVYIRIDPIQLIPFMDLSLLLEEVINLMSHLNCNFEGTLSSSFSLEDYLGKISRESYDQNSAEAKELNKQSNLLKLFFTGIKGDLKLDIAPSARKLVFSMLFDKLKSWLNPKPQPEPTEGDNSNKGDSLPQEEEEDEDDTPSNKLVSFLLLALQSTKLKMKFNSQDPYDILTEMCGDDLPDIPDAVDLVDYIGKIYEKSGMHDIIRKAPVLQQTMNKLESYGSAEFSLTFGTDKGSVTFDVELEGLGKLYELISSGMA